MNLSDYRRLLISEAVKFLDGDKKKGKIIFAVGAGRLEILMQIIMSLLDDDSEKNILLLFSRRTIGNNVVSLFKRYFREEEWKNKVNRLKVVTYQELNMMTSSKLMGIDVVISDEAHLFRDEDGLKFGSDTKFLGILSVDNNDNWFKDAVKVFEISVADAIKYGYVNKSSEIYFIEYFFKKLILSLGYKDIVQEMRVKHGTRFFSIDIVASKDKINYAFEIKLYRSYNNVSGVIRAALQQMIEYRDSLNCCDDKEYKLIAVMLCGVDKSLKEKAYKEFGIIIWDVSNLLYLCNGNKELLNLLVTYITYPLDGIVDEKPLGIDEVIENIKVKEVFESKYDYFSNRLDKCKPGIENYKEYENICTDIIKYLFETEFSQMSSQHKTSDDMFKMDLLCSLKGTTEFWKFLIQFYSTKFVVFEYKNYASSLNQNLIYVTKKYLFPIALRNVAFIISRYGFDDNAVETSYMILKNDASLIVDLTDKDLLMMIEKKENGEEPSDYLLNKVEQFLMSISN